ncbi:hypothetical protein AC1031_016349 [Aphanomyces cochlioides]|nr:hypothetical protein AC1031_016349 [Aphanomyces cochlioides]
MAYILLASEMTIALKRSFDSKQVQDKLTVSKMKADWAMSNPSLPAQTGNDAKCIQPAYFDIMMEYWSDKKGYQRESLFSTDDPNDDDDNSSHGSDSASSDSEQELSQSKRRRVKNTMKKTQEKKQRSQAEAIESGFAAVKDGLIAMAGAIAIPSQPPSSSFDSVLEILQTQSNQLGQLIALLSKKDNSQS